MDLHLTNHTAVVVGAATGIGRAIAETFAAEGAHVGLTDISPAVAEVATEIAAAHGVRSAGVVADVSNPAAMARAAEQIEAQVGPVDHLVYAAGMACHRGGRPFWNQQPSDWPRMIDVNLLGGVYSVYAFLHNFTERRRGTILFIASVAGQMGSQTDPPYSAAKAGMINFSQCAAKDLASYGVRVNTLNPGMVATALNRNVWAGQMENLPPEQRVDFETWGREKVGQVVPLGRWQTPQDIANMAVFLASSRADSVTGQTINVDGGFVMHW